MGSIKLIKKDFPELMICRAIADGNCFFHCILQAVSEEYKNMSDIGKREQVLEFRLYLARNLELKVDDGIVYDKLSRGNLKDFGKAVPNFTLKNMQDELCGNNFVDNKYNELISNTLNVDIYLIDSKSQDIYLVGDDADILYFNRPSIVILYSEDALHYDLIGYTDENIEYTIFPASHRFIKTLRRRIDILLGKIENKKD